MSPPGSGRRLLFRRFDALRGFDDRRDLPNRALRGRGREGRIGLERAGDIASARGGRLPGRIALRLHRRAPAGKFLRRHVERDGAVRDVDLDDIVGFDQPDRAALARLRRDMADREAGGNRRRTGRPSPGRKPSPAPCSSDSWWDRASPACQDRPSALHSGLGRRRPPSPRRRGYRRPRHPGSRRYAPVPRRSGSRNRTPAVFTMQPSSAKLP